MKTIITSVLLIAIMSIHAQKTYLKIHKDDNNLNTVSYPPGTEFELRTKHNYIVLKYSETPRVFEIEDDYKLIVYPTYKKEKDVYKLRSGAKVELKIAEDFSSFVSKLKSALNGADEVTATTKITNSKKLSGKKNLYFELSNGIKFEYTDGKYSAKLKDEYIDIRGKYSIKTKLGKLMISFNSDDGQIWWLFEENKKSKK